MQHTPSFANITYKLKIHLLSKNENNLPNNNDNIKGQILYSSDNSECVKNKSTFIIL